MYRHWTWCRCACASKLHLHNPPSSRSTGYSVMEGQSVALSLIGLVVEQRPCSIDCKVRPAHYVVTVSIYEHRGSGFPPSPRGTAEA